MRPVPLAVMLVAALALFTGLGSTGYLDVREARDVQVARELLERREVLTPLLGAEPHLEKPVLAYAPEALVQWLGGSPARSRALRAGLALVLLLVTFAAGASRFGARAGWLATGVLATSLALPLAVRADGTQLLASLLAWVACAGFADVLFGRAPGRDLRLVVTWGALATALVVAGPWPAVWVLGALGLHLALARTPDAWRHARPLAGLTLMLGVALPWYGAMFERHGAAFLEHAALFPYAAEARGPWYAGLVLAVPFVVVGLFPWSTLLPGAALHASTWWRRGTGTLLRMGARGPELNVQPVERERREEGASHFFIACLFAALAPIVFYPTPPLTAALPALPAAALLCGRLLDHLLEDPDRVAPLVARATQMLALTGTVGALMVHLLAARVREAGPDLRLLAVLLFAGSWLPFLAGFLGRRRLAAALIALPVAVGTPFVTLRVLPGMESWLSARAVAEAMESVAPPHAPLVLLEPAPPSLRHYSARNLVIAEPGGVALRELRGSDGLAYVAVRPYRERDLARHAGGPVEILLRSPTLVLARVTPG